MQPVHAACRLAAERHYDCLSWASNLQRAYIRNELSSSRSQTVALHQQVFPVKRKLLRPCIALTSAVRSDAETAAIHIDVGTLTFDRCWILAHLCLQPLKLPSLV